MAALELQPVVEARTETTVIPQVVARASLLELSAEELEKRVQKELEKNPSLRLKYPGGCSYFPQTQSTSESEYDSFAGIAASKTLRDELLWQLQMRCDNGLLQTARYVVENLDERGYMTANIAQITEQLQVDRKQVEGAFEVVQRLEAAGVGARGLTECLRMQAEGMDQKDRPPGLIDFITGRLRQLIRNRQPQPLASMADDAGAGQFMEFIAENMYPYPAAVYAPDWRTVCRVDSSAPPKKQPDAIVERRNGSLQVHVPLSKRLALIVDSAYERLANKIEGTSATDDHRRIKKLVNDAKEFISNVTSRHETIRRVTEVILEKQSEYFENGTCALEPMTKKQLAAQLDVHESTICRATQDKSMMMPEGEVIPYDTFFDDTLPAKATLQLLIRRESPETPLTDAELAEKMGNHGYGLARRTVNKYRISLGIASAAERKELKAAS